MKKSLLSTFLIIALFMLGNGASLFGQAQLPHYESFDYTSGTALQTQTGWTAVNSGDDITVTTGNLSIVGLPSSIGNKISFAEGGIDAYKSITAQSSGTVYYSFILKVTDVSTASAGGYFTGFGQNSTTFGGCVWVKSNGSDFNIGLTSRTSTSAITYSESVYAINTEIFVVVSYQFNSETGDDVVKLWINPASADFGSVTAPTPNITITNTGGTDLTGISSIFIRQDSNTETASMEMDELRVATSWADVTADKNAPVATIFPAEAATDIAVNVVPTITFTEAIKKTDGSEVTDADLTTLVKFKKTSSIGEDVPCTMTIDAAKKVITITPSADLLNSQTYYIECGEVEDAFGNTGVVKSATFTTIAATTPSLAITAPVAGTTYHAGDNVTITWTSANITNVSIDVYESGTFVTNLTASTAAAAGSFALTIPADAGYSAAYTIRISNADDAAFYVTSDPFTIIGVATDLADLRARFASGDVVKLTGEATVTFLRPANRNQKYIQDATAGLLIDDAVPVLTTTVAVGDNIKDLEGKLGLYGGVLQIVPTVATVTVASSGNTVTIPEVGLADYITNYLQYESELIKIRNVWFTAGDGAATFSGSTNYDLTDGTSTIVFRTFKSGDGDIVGSVIPKNHLDGIFIGGFYNATVQLFGRNMADFTLLSSDKAITALAFNGLTPAVNATIDENAKTIAATVPAGTDLTTLVPTITISAKATVSPTSGSTVNFTNPVVFTVTAEDGTAQAYTVTVSLGTGIDDNPQANVTVYPVPATVELKINNIGSVKYFEVFNAAGVKIETVRTDGVSFYPMPVASYKPGLYFIRFTTENGVFMKKFMKR